MPNRALTRRDPPQGKKGLSANQGFTLIELMIVVAVIAVLASVALPSYRSFIEKRQVTSSAEQLAAFISSAQMTSVKHSQNVAVVFTPEDLSSSSDREWCVGMIIVDNPEDVVDDPDTNEPCNCMLTDPTADGACQIDGRLQTLKADPAGDPTHTSLKYPDTLSEMSANGLTLSNGSNGALVFDPARGLLFDPSNSEALFEFVSTGEGLFGLNVLVTATGRVKLCSDATKRVPGYEPCS